MVMLESPFTVVVAYRNENRSEGPEDGRPDVTGGTELKVPDAPVPGD
jgi:hypothetical protein